MISYDDRAKQIGARIKKERIALRISIKDFLTEIYMSSTSHKTLTAWEKGEKIPDLTSLARMAELFHCDIGYLLGDYDERQRTFADVKEQTGLSEEAILALQNMNPKQIAITVLNSVLVQPEIEQWFFQIYRIACHRCVCENLRETAVAERMSMENKRLTTQAELALERDAIPKLESAELQEFKRHHKMIEGVVSDLSSTNDNVKEFGTNGAKHGLEEKENG